VSWTKAVREAHLSLSGIDFRGWLRLDPLELPGERLQLAQVRSLHLLRISDTFHYQGDEQDLPFFHTVALQFPVDPHPDTPSAVVMLGRLAQRIARRLLGVGFSQHRPEA
jgi:hypothetical protein